MIQLTSIEFLYLLPFLIILIVITHFKIFERFKKSFIFYHTLGKVLRGKKVKDYRLKLLLLKVLITSLVILVVSDPYYKYTRVVETTSTVVSTIELEGTRPSVIIILDVSGSMSGAKIIEAKEAIQNFIHKLPLNYDIGFIAFNDKVVCTIPPTNDTDKIVDEIKGLLAEGGTEYYEPLYIALNWLKPYRLLRIPVAVVFVTDGMPADYWYREILDEYVDKGIPVYTVFIGVSREGVRETKFIAEKTDGLQFTASDVDKLSDVLSKIREEIVNRIEVSSIIRETIEVEEYYPLKIPLIILILILFFVLLYLRYSKYKIFY